MYLDPSLADGVTYEQLRAAKCWRRRKVGLTPRKLEVLKFLAAGRRTREIAQILNLSVKTVESHRAQLMEQLGVHSIAELVRYAIRTGLLPSEDE